MLGALLQPMFAAIPNDGAFSGGSAEAQWRPMLVEQYGRAMARAGGVGISQAVLAEMQRLQAQGTQAAHAATPVPDVTP
ncbi:rod-binding protein [Roseomonas sp. SSH11]|uniref:Rod-binding protein n=1 Tax=Pararoseomonas baculiformis TaxID=2820812 RepID=A0ABS4AKA6_9PROT|nr:rod-binding protein [Pararoseomonas baculiformis]MBP0447472.1 rod-binding protein [Pararoseomonas baculiformis]